MSDVSGAARAAILAKIQSGDSISADELIKPAPGLNREHMIDAAWDLVDDGILTYYANATFRRGAK